MSDIYNMKYLYPTSPCPFCGRNDFLALEEKVIGPGKVGRDTPCTIMKQVRLRCDYCGAQGPTMTIESLGHEDSEAAAVERWNTRAGADAKKFETGQIYINTDWFTGGTSRYEVVDINRKSQRIRFKVSRNESDGEFVSSESFPIQTDKDGNESVLLYKYYGHTNIITAEAEKGAS